MLAKLTSSDRAQTEREVITCLFHLLNATEPQVPVTKGFDEELEELLVSLLEEDILSVDFGTWGLIFECIDKANLKRSTGTRYGRPLLDFVGYLWLALHDGGDAAIPRTAAIQLLIAVQRKDSRYARYCIDTAGQWLIETTPEGEKAIGYPVKLSLPKPPLTLWYSVQQGSSIIYSELSIRLDPDRQNAATTNQFLPRKGMLRQYLPI